MNDKDRAHDIRQKLYENKRRRADIDNEDYSLIDELGEIVNRMAISCTKKTPDVPPLEDRVFVATDGSDSNSGTIDSPFATIEHATANPGPDGVYVRGGNYYTDVNITNGGTAAKKLNVCAYPGETPHFDPSNYDNWSLEDGSLDIYCTAGNYSSGVWTGQWWDGSQWQTLLPYQDNADFTSNIMHVVTGNRYVGPGLFHRNGKVCIRTTPVNQADTCSGVSQQFVPDITNVRFFPANDSGSGTFNHNADNVIVDGLKTSGSIIGHYLPIGRKGICIINSNIDTTFIAVRARGGNEDILVENNSYTACHPEWLAWTDMKEDDDSSFPINHFSAKTTFFSINGTGRSRRIKVLNNFIKRVFDGGAWTDVEDADWNNNTGTFLDDMIQLGTNSTDIRVLENDITGAALSDNATGGSGNLGTVYFAKNVRRPVSMLWGKRDPSDLLRDNYKGCRDAYTFGSHGGNYGGGPVWKIYHNTMVSNTDGLPPAQNYQLAGNINTTSAVHEVYNNIFEVLDNGYHDDKLNAPSGIQNYDSNAYVGGRFREDYNGSTDYATVAAYQTANPNGYDQNSSDTVAGVTTLQTIPAAWPCAGNLPNGIGA